MISFGSDKIDTVLKVDKRLCPYCGRHCCYKLKRTYFVLTILFIPCFPLGEFETYTECSVCGGRYVLQNPEVRSAFVGCDTSQPELLYIVASFNKRIFAFLVDIIILLFFNWGLSVFLESYPEANGFLPQKFLFTVLFFWFVYFF